MAEPPPKKLVCNHCGSQDVQVEALATWSAEDQQWNFVVCGDSVDFCGACMAETSVDFVPVDDVRTAAKIAINQGETQ